MHICNQQINLQTPWISEIHICKFIKCFMLYIQHFICLFLVCVRVVLLDWADSWTLTWVSVLKGVLKIYVEENCVHDCNLNFRWIIRHKSSKCLGTKPICTGYFVLVLIQKTNHLGKNNTKMLEFYFVNPILTRIEFTNTRTLMGIKCMGVKQKFN